MEEARSEMQTPVYLYDRLSPFALSLSDQSSPPNRSPSSSEPEPYHVFRNELSVPDNDLMTTQESAPQDYFSLDLRLDEPDRINDASDVPVTPAASGKKSKKKDKKEKADETAPSLESSWFTGNSRFKSPMLQLHKEIVEFCDFLSPTLDEQALRNAAVKSVSDVIKYIWPSCEVEVFGSYRTGLYLPTSDIDVVILDSGIKHSAMGLQALARALAQKGIAKKIHVIAKARVPIIKFVEKKSNIAFDISFDAQNGPKAAEFIQDAVSRWPPLRPLCLILKVFLQQRELNEVYTGGIGSYALLAMLISMLKYYHEGQACPEHNLGVLLVNFFDFYGRKLNTADVGVSCREGSTFFSKTSKGFLNNGRSFLIAIEDPQTPENDVGKSSFNYFQIRSAFSMAYSTLTNPKTILGLAPHRSILGTIIRPDPVLLERKGGLNGEMTFNTLLPGAGEPLQMNNGTNSEILCNWQMDDDEPLPRGDNGPGSSPRDVCVENSSGKKRKSSSKDKSSKKKRKEKGDVGKGKLDEESGKRKEKSAKKRRHRRPSHGDPSGYGEVPWSY